MEVKPDEANPVRRSKRIKEKPGPALDQELKGDNDDSADLDYA